MKYIISIIVFLNTLLLFGQTPSNDPHWEELWKDDFNFFDNTKWVKANYAIHSPEPQIYLISNVYTLNGQLVIKVNNNSVTCPPNPTQTTWACGLAAPGQSYPYNSGWIETKQVYNTQYGFIEARIKLPYGFGFWPAFWTFAGSGLPNNINAAEIDIFENLGHKPANIITTNIHKNYPDGNIYYEEHIPTNYSWANTWHTYAVEWSPSKIVWYLDGSPIRTFPNHGIIDPVRIILNLAIEPGYLPNSSTPFPSNMYVDYVKVYELDNDCNTNLNVCNYNFSSHDNRVKKIITIGNGSCSNSLNSGDNVYLRASEGVLINGDFTVPVGAELYIDVNPCY